jgi:NAD(P)-dependent dehydrogenase (short-subunit alcohol dehydrogenase family)
MIAVTGSASGIGAAVRARLAREGAAVIGVDVRDAEVLADLATPDGRARAIAWVGAAAAGRLTGLVCCAGLGPHVDDRAAIVSVNYFGATVLADGLRDLLAGAAPAAAVVVSSNAAVLPGADAALADACLAGDEAGARTRATALDGHAVYAGSKRALTRWMRRRAASPAWAGVGVRLNAVAPGPIETPLLAGGLAHPVYGPAIRGFPVPAGRFGQPDDVAAAVAFLLAPEAAFCCGAVLFVDGGTDALLRPDDC